MGKYIFGDDRIAPKYWGKVEIAESGCWLWKGAPNNKGYGRLTFLGKRQYAHRFFYQSLSGDIPEEKVIDHACHNRDAGCTEWEACCHRMCVNPDHLEPVTQQENLLRSRLTQTHMNKGREVCIRGHEFSPRIGKDGQQWRVCKECQKQWREADRIRNADRLREYNRAYHAANAERISERKRNRRLAKLSDPGQF